MIFKDLESNPRYLGSIPLENAKQGREDLFPRPSGETKSFGLSKRLRIHFWEGMVSLRYFGKTLYETLFFRQWIQLLLEQLFNITP
ncbi:MAG: hypothetical protein COB67_12475 [SAR324 cluster bacterium]|uniref:Uncharacterized protein n=1 Tax=SAR324 cluster bacterium TaxID=2024889 RepID=A0A2A4SRY9_9DELT|nr:MAG: hypothetical protein COB67_12475 [SAR324 cluster bacterium]